MVGSKAANLGEITKLDCAVPDGFCVTTYAYEHFIRKNNLREGLLSFHGDLSVSDHEEIIVKAQKMEHSIASGEIPEEVVEEVISAYSLLDASAPVECSPVAIRSSATVEDLPKTSFAGQFRTFLGICGADSVLHSIRECWASLYLPRVVAYMGNHEVVPDASEFKMGVIVQEMLESEVSGVLFTVDPLGKDPDVAVVEATWGLGESVVSGQVTPDTFHVKKDTFRIVKRKLGSKSTLIRSSEKGVESMDTPNRLKDQFCLEDSLVGSIVRQGNLIEQYFSQPQDIEWAIQGGKVFILQTRPITTLPSSKC